MNGSADELRSQSCEESLSPLTLISCVFVHSASANTDFFFVFSPDLFNGLKGIFLEPFIRVFFFFLLSDEGQGLTENYSNDESHLAAEDSQFAQQHIKPLNALIASQRSRAE